MIKIGNKIEKKQPNFWNNCIFHPTDAIEDPWGKRILNRIAKDKAINTVRIYAMFEDIVYEDENGEIAYDFRLNDLRLDYLIEKGYNILISYGMMPKILSSNAAEQSNASKNKTRYKGKMLYTSKPTDYKIWEDICYEYTKHIVERYGIDTVSKWYLHCYNEPDLGLFFMKDATISERLDEYVKLYKGFVNGILRVTDELHFGGPALAHEKEFLDGFLNKIREENIRIDYIALHNYAGTGYFNAEEKGFATGNWIETHNKLTSIIKENGFANTEIVYDEWGMAAQGFFNLEECPAYIARDTEVFSSYYVKLICEIIRNNLNISKIMLCLSGQHEMTTDFSGFRNFFTMNFFAKPIYNSFVLASKVYDGLLSAECDNENIYTIPTKSDNGDYAVLLTYASQKHEENIPDITENLVFEEDIAGKKVTIWCIDKNNTNPYRLYEKTKKPDMDEEMIKLLRKEGNIKPYKEFILDTDVTLQLSANCVYLVEIRR